MDIFDNVGPRDGQVLVAPFVFSAAEVGGPQAAVADGGEDSGGCATAKGPSGVGPTHSLLRAFLGRR